MSSYKTDITHPTLETLERRHIYRVLKAKKGNLSKAAQVLGIDRRTLYRKLDKYAKQRRATFVTIDYVSAYPASLTKITIPGNTHEKDTAKDNGVTRQFERATGSDSKLVNET